MSFIVAISILLSLFSCNALVIPPRLVGNGIIPPLAEEPEVIQLQGLKIRSSTENDVPEISHILAMSLLGVEETSSNIAFNFKKQMELLRTKAGVDSLLRSRIQTMESAKEIECPILDLKEETDQLRYLWSHPKFVKKMEHSALLSKEPHLWKHHNFACAPESSCWLQHKMITAFDKSSEKIVGFCEVAMLSRPCGTDFAPTVMNLATSAEYRRQGIATNIIESACRYVRQEWNCDELSLYVDIENKAAISLYQHIGFEGSTLVETDSSAQLYMAKQLIGSITSAVEPSLV
jgi:ribosomal protein S18 acetylase RimI-like enzyme